MCLQDDKRNHATKKSPHFYHQFLKLEVQISETVTHDRQKKDKIALKARN